MRDDRLCGALGDRTRVGRGGERLGPEARGIGVEPQDDLGLALGDERLEALGEARGAQPFSAFFSPDPAVKRGTLEALIWIFSPVEGLTP